ncbi:helix-turn-helix transcriptional regulator [Shewanella sp. VB17]|nr:helix-turn-helix transcriptional regulator [Shewanella sp. VB17]
MTELANKLECSRQTIYNWEEGISEPKLSQFLRLCVIVGLSPSNLFPDIATINRRTSNKEIHNENQSSTRGITK